MESQSKSITMKGCTEAAMRAIVDYVYTGDMDLRKYGLATLSGVTIIQFEGH